MKQRVSGLPQLARLYGVETTYEGMGGERRRADAEALALTLRALGASIDEDGRGAARALDARRSELDALGIQPVQVAWDGALPQLRVRLAHGESERAAVEIRLESGEVIPHACRAEPVNARARGGWSATHSLRIGRRLPHGYHQVQVETSGATFQTFVISAPRHAHAPLDTREWGVFAPLYALYTESSWGIGDYGDLARAATWAGGLGAGFFSTLPLLATFLDAPFEPSPYSPASRLFWSEIFIDVTAVPGWTPEGDVRSEIAASRKGDLVDYRGVAALKRRELERARVASASDVRVRDALSQFAAANPHVRDYARFRAVCDRRREAWLLWPERMQQGELRDGDYAPEDADYHLFAQWQADHQLAAVGAARHGGAAALYLDMPLGVNAAGYDAWRFRDLFAEGVSAGAPPDPLFTGGQDWGFRPLKPEALRASGYQYLIDTLRHHFRHAPMLRLDHVMSLYRLFWVPGGISAKRGVYVRYPEDELFAILCLESARHRAVVVGEDLGTVPPAVRRAMDSHSVHRMHVVQFEAAPDADAPANVPDENVVASLNTHDMPLFAGFWRGSEIDDQLDLGLIDEEEHAAALEERAQLRRTLSRSVGAGGEVEPELVRQRLLERLAASPARYVLVTLEDLWLEDRPQNVPGTSDERPNWQRRASRSLNEITADAAVRRMLNAIGERRRTPPSRTQSND
ncbi:MAG TPA: 4-alpha-glucanotransferase [Longimicrobiales bacterium]|nr:4-alpha-glucanotransferase [Longimicrobiales bacterium]